MLLRRSVLPTVTRSQWPCLLARSCSARRRLTTLAVETSCDDTSVAIVEKGVHNGSTVARLHFHKKITSNNTEFQGVYPLLALKSHQENLANLLAEAIEHLPKHGGNRRLPDFISVTRGPGMRSNLMCGLDTAKGLAVAWQKPLVGVHHMQAHALTPRLVSALDSYSASEETISSQEPLVDGIGDIAPVFPVLSVLASGGHTILINSTSLTDHAILGGTDDIAVGDCLDKAARVILPAEELQTAKSTMYGALLETFAFSHLANANTPPQPTKRELSGLTADTYLASHGHTHSWYTAPANNHIALERSKTQWGWSITQPLTKARGGNNTNTMSMSFSGLVSAVNRFMQYPTDPATGKVSKTPREPEDVSLSERRDLATSIMRAAFEHIALRVVRALRHSSITDSTSPAVVMSGGVASNAFLRHVLASTLCVHGFGEVRLYFPPPKYCTDNAAMIGWTGIEMFEAGFVDDLALRAIRKWPLDELLTPVVDGKL